MRLADAMNARIWKAQRMNLSSLEFGTATSKRGAHASAAGFSRASAVAGKGGGKAEKSVRAHPNALPCEDSESSVL